MTVLVFSDSHGAKNFMRACIDQFFPDAILHLGDYYGDGKKLREEYPDISFYQVPGNCDEYRDTEDCPLVRVVILGGVKMFMTHGHLHGVKQTEYSLIRDAQASGADLALYGHTHEAVCHQEESGMWVMNPGTCGYFGASAGLVEIQKGKIISCDILRP